MSNPGSKAKFQEKSRSSPPSANDKKAKAKEYEEQRKNTRLMQAGLIEKPVVTINDTEIFVAAQRLMLREGSDPSTEAKGFLQKDQRVAIRKRVEVAMIPPIERLQVATPTVVDVLGWIDAVKNEKPTLLPAPSEEAAAPAPAPAAAATAAATAAASAGTSAAAASSSASKKTVAASDVNVQVKTAPQGLLASFWAKSHAAVLRHVFFREKVDKSDAGLAKRFALVDSDSSGTISSKEMKDYILSVYGEGQQKVVNAMMKAADTNQDGEVDLDEFKVFMRGMPDTKKREGSFKK